MSDESKPPPEEPLAKLPEFDLRPRTHPEAILEDHWRFFDLTPEQRAEEQSKLMAGFDDIWWSRPEEERERIEWAKAWGAHYEILQRWAREYREQSADNP